MTRFANSCSNSHRGSRRGSAVLAAAITALAPAIAAAQSSSQPAPGTWRFGLSLYGYLPTLSGTSSSPADSSGTSITVDADKIVDSLKFTVMGTFDAHNGQWGLFTDVMYLNLGGDKQNSRDFTIGGAAIPASTTADLGLDFKGLIWTLAGQYRVYSAPGINIDLLGGARWADVRTTARWNISGNLGPLLPAGRSGNVESKQTLLDGIVGVKGRVGGLGSSGQWSLPFYVDVGTGDSDLTWQVAGGVSYGFKWGELTGMWRYLSYDMKSGRNLEDLSFNGPMIGATWRW